MADLNKVSKVTTYENPLVYVLNSEHNCIAHINLTTVAYINDFQITEKLLESIHSLGVTKGTGNRKAIPVAFDRQVTLSQHHAKEIEENKNVKSN